MINISHHGAVSGVTGSCHELSITPSDRSHPSAGILIDCGLFQGADAAGKSSVADLSIDFPLAHIRALVLTHVHIDHVGRIPYLLAAGFSGPIICTEPSAIMLPEILEDALKIGFTRDRALIERVLGLIRQRLVSVPYGQWHSVFVADDETGGSLDVHFQPAGHILGSAYVECDVTAVGQEGAHGAEGEGEHVGEQGELVNERIVFSGDLGAAHAPLLTAPVSPKRADRLVIESTYGDKDHEDRTTRRLRLKQVLQSALADGGTVIVPAFSIGRTQDLLYEIESLIHEFGAEPVALGVPWQNLEIVVDSPLAAEFTRIYRKLKPMWDAEAQEVLSQGRHSLGFDQLTLINSHASHLEAVEYLASFKRPAVVLAGSGMCAGGRVVNYLKAMLGDARNDVLFVGYQASGTPSRDILKYGSNAGVGTPDQAGWVELDDKRYPICARIHQVGGYSAHAGQSDLLNFVLGIPNAPREIRLVHGDDGAKAALKKLFEAEVKSQVVIAE
ncbi:RNA procession exonuclease [Marinobacter psychrophilus]|uniref:RNA procession exonuclease n=1 Tax=Marinobacter psychrophilus TaxID=330734 RepID=A0A0H4I200_9GAMM|nr:MBL fold metallo-hydrolase [Marinobacter psychrophilus]AKO52984.1 RNA procession exonuclease [Marinobacter psychrophilus]